MRRGEQCLLVVALPFSLSFSLEYKDTVSNVGTRVCTRAHSCMHASAQNIFDGTVDPFPRDVMVEAIATFLAQEIAAG
jgi:hypothetical protein